MSNQLVAQIGDRVRIEQPLRYHGCVGTVVRQFPCAAPSVTARVCDVAIDGVGEVRVHADFLAVWEAPDAE